jgi:hypothetical protein
MVGEPAREIEKSSAKSVEVAHIELHTAHNTVKANNLKTIDILLDEMR